MKLKMIQLNIMKGKYLPAVITFLRKEDPDIITMQEVTSGEENFWKDRRLDLFSYLKKALKRRGTCIPHHHLRHDAESYYGNAVFTKGTILSEKAVWLRPYRRVPSEGKRKSSLVPRNALDVTIRLKGKTLHVLSVHGAWTREPRDTEEKLRQMRILTAHLRGLAPTPFLLGGDLNMEPESRVIHMLNRAGRNIMIHSGIERTTHPRLHKTVSFKPDGLLVDYICTSPHFTVQTIDAPVVDVSDHLPVRAVLSI